MCHPGWILVVLGFIIAVIGAAWMLSPQVPWLGKLPGDMVVQGKNFCFYLPLTTSIILSILLTIILTMIRYLSK